MTSDSALMTQNFSEAKKIHCIGIGGSGLSALARLLKQQGRQVSGSDEQSSPLILALAGEGITVHIGHAAKNLPPETEFVIYSSAIPDKNPELLQARKNNLKTLSYPEAVGLLTGQKRTIAVCGTHGKTTTAAMIAASLLACNEDPTVLVGADLHELANRNERLGRGKYLVLEACEYRRAFLNFQPQVIVLTNIEADHLDYYKDLKDYQKAFREFMDKLPEDGLLIANYDDENVRAVCRNFTRAQIRWFGLKKGPEFQLIENSVYKKDKKIIDLHLQIPGRHNLMNALACAALASSLNLDLYDVKSALENFHGAARRFEYLGQTGKTVLYDDYAHHPTEIRATLSAAREKFGAKAKILCIFQPHQYSRTLQFLSGFAGAFKDANEVIVPNILRVRDSDSDVKKINEEKLVEALKKAGTVAIFGHGFEKTAALARARLADFDVVIIMGAGDVWKVGEMLLGKKTK